MYDEFCTLDVPKILIILAPNNAEALPKAGLIYESVKKNAKDFHLYLAPLNSLKYLSGNNLKTMDNIWVPYIEAHKEPQMTNRGMYISLSERAKLQDLMINIIRSVVINKTEEKLKVLHSKLQPKKRGFFGRETLDPYPNLEQDLRLAGDLAFLFQDYYNAVSFYGKLFERIAKKGTAYAEIGSCKEFMALAGLITGYSIKEFSRDMEFAAGNYIKEGNWDLFTRNAIISHEILSLARLYGEAANYLEKSARQLPKSTEIPALLYEQSAYAILRTSPPMVRKFVQHMLISGELYLEQKLFKNAVYCLGISYYLYENTGWPEILMRLCGLLITVFDQIDDFLNTFRFYRKLLEVVISIEPEENHSEVYAGFIESAAKLSAFIKEPQGETKKAAVVKLFNVPRLVSIYPDSVELITSQDKFYCNSKETFLFTPGKLEGIYNESQSWTSLGKMIDGDMSSIHENVSNPKLKAREEILRDLLFCDELLPRKRLLLYNKKRRIIHSMEPVQVKFRMRNNVNADMNITKVTLLCHYIKASQGESLQYTTYPVTFMLGPLETKELILSILPRECGELCIDGIEWEISDTIQGFYSFFQVTGKKDPIIITVKSKSGQLIVNPEGMLRLEYLDGELDQYTLIFKNTGHYIVEDIVLQTDYPLFMGWKSIALDWKLAPLEERPFAISFRATALDQTYATYITATKILIRYSSYNPTTKVKYVRYARTQHVFSVIPSFTANTTCERSKTSFDQYFVNLKVENVGIKTEKFSLKELHVIDEGWGISERKRVEGLNKVFNMFIDLKHHEEEDLESKMILLEKYQEEQVLEEEESPKIQENANHIKEYREHHKSFELLEKPSVDMVALWTIECGKHLIKGAHFLTIPLENNTSNEEIHEKLPLQVLVSCKEEINHDFATDPTCSIPLMLDISNILHQPISFRFEANKKEKYLLWEGCSTKNVVGLVPNGKTQIFLKATVSDYGVYNLNRFTFKFFKDINTGHYISPVEGIKKDLKAEVYKLQYEEIIANVSPLC